ALPKQTSGIVEAIRQLSVARNGALKARTAARQQLDSLIITAPEQLRGKLRQARTLKARTRLCLQLRPDSNRLHQPAEAAKLALRSLPDPSQQRPNQPPPTRLRRRPTSQPRPPHDRRLPPPPLPTHPGLRRQTQSRRPQQTRNPPLPQALHRPRDLPHAARRPR